MRFFEFRCTAFSIRLGQVAVRTLPGADLFNVVEDGAGACDVNSDVDSDVVLRVVVDAFDDVYFVLVQCSDALWTTFEA